MKPLSLEMSAFAAFRERSRIDFSSLELFAISGATGSGKSTILDAMTYALYGHVARIGSKNLDSLISSKKTQMFVKFEFENSSGTYRVTRTADRKPSGKVTRNTRIEELIGARWKQLAESEKLKDADKKLEQIVGLDYEGFTRAIFLPQGAFDEFLKGDASKRRKLLVKLLNLDRIENMQKEAGRLARVAKQNVDNILERLEQDYRGANLQRKSELLNELSETEIKQKEMAKKESLLKEEMLELEKLKDLFNEKMKIVSSLERLKAREAEIAYKRVRLEQARTVSTLLPELQRLDKLELKQDKYQHDIKTISERIDELKESLSRQQSQIDGLRSKKEKRIPEIEKMLQEIDTLKPLLEKLKDRGGSLELARTPAPKLKYSDESWFELQNKKARMPELERLATIIAGQEVEIKRIEEDTISIDERIANLEIQKNQIMQKGKEAGGHLEALKEERKQLQLKHQAAAIRQELHDGEKCPVCQNIYKSNKDQSENENVDFAQISSQIEQSEKTVNDLRGEYRNISAELKANAVKKEERKISLERLQIQLQENRKSLEQLLQELQINDIAKAKTNLAKEEKELLIALASEIAQLSSSENPDNYAKALLKEKNEITKGLEDLEKLLTATVQDLELNKEKLKTLTEQKTELSNEISAINKRLSLEIEKAGFASQAEAKNSSLTLMDIKALELEINGFAVELETLKKRLLELDAKLSGKKNDDVLLEAKREQIISITTDLVETTKNMGRIAAELEQLEKELARAQTLRESLEAEQQRYDTYYALSLDLRGTELQAFLLTQVQSRLARRASDIILEVTDGRYDLRLIDGEYQVRDSWLNAEARNVKTLSGGETFIASLALALALSDTIAGQSLGALFLDEGFGALDAETLEAVSNVLRNLSKSGRMVGVISHVKSLTEKMPACLTVVKTKMGSSLSWDLA